MRNINNYNIIRTQVLLMFSFVISLVVLISNERTDTNTSIFAFILYLPYVFFISLYNGLLLKLLVSFLKSNVLIYLSPIVPFMIWFIISDYSVTIRFWKMNGKEVLIGLTIMAFVNLFGYYFYNSEKNITEK